MKVGRHMTGVVGKDLPHARTAELPARLVINCTGPCADITLGKASSDVPSTSFTFQAPREL
ncbi:MAG TPA: hypothetical protein PLS81_08745 [Deltaproteobacteria bacterium]|nr:hypothetical protein [Deltaproteobacteria bacterium]HOM29530.1 hypothetical protein [Deltaproteobacteria bacterium]HPP80639.1 hypothetical protein [Deltaproteobacteria bacterium]